MPLATGMWKSKNEEAESMEREQAEILGLHALGYIAGGEFVERFLALSGLTPEGLRDSAGDAATLVALLDFVLFDDALVVATAEAIGFTPEDLVAARRALIANDRPAAGEF